MPEILTADQITNILTPHQGQGLKALASLHPMPSLEQRRISLTKSIEGIKTDSRADLQTLPEQFSDTESLIARAGYIMGMQSDELLMQDTHITPERAEMIMADLLHEAIRFRDPDVGTSTYNPWHGSRRHVPDDVQVEAIDSYLHSLGTHDIMLGYRTFGTFADDLNSLLQPLRDDPIAWWLPESQESVKDRLALVDNRAPSERDYYLLRGQDVLGFSSSKAQEYAYLIEHINLQFGQLREYGGIVTGTQTELLDNILALKDHDNQIPFLVDTLSRFLLKGTLSLDQVTEIIQGVENNATIGAGSDDVAIYHNIILHKTLEKYAKLAIGIISRRSSRQDLFDY